MLRISDAAVGVQSGSVLMFSAFSDGGEMWAGSGDRMVSQTVRFDESFIHPPVVHLGLDMWDTDREANQRLDIRAADITTTGFTIQFRTWNDSRIARVRAAWMAIGAVPYQDDWDPVD